MKTLIKNLSVDKVKVLNICSILISLFLSYFTCSGIIFETQDKFILGLPVGYFIFIIYIGLYYFIVKYVLKLLVFKKIGKSNKITEKAYLKDYLILLIFFSFILGFCSIILLIFSIFSIHMNIRFIDGINNMFHFPKFISLISDIPNQSFLMLIFVLDWILYVILIIFLSFKNKIDNKFKFIIEQYSILIIIFIILLITYFIFFGIEIIFYLLLFAGPIIT